MDAAGGGHAHAATDDLGALPADLQEQSLSRGTIILPFDSARRAIEERTAAGRRLQNWEGWVKVRDGSRVKSLNHPGSFALPHDAKAAADSAIAGMQRALVMWDRAPEYEGGVLYFGLTFG